MGVEAAVEDINKLGGVYVEEYKTKIPVELIVTDSESDAIKAATLTEDMILSDNVRFFVGGITPPGMNSPMGTTVERHKVPMVTGVGPFEPWLSLRNSISPPWQYVWSIGFRVGMPFPEDDFRSVPGYTLADLTFALLNEFGEQTNKQVGLFGLNDSDGQAWYQIFPPIFEEAGYNVIGLDEQLGLFSPDTTDYTSIINEWKKNDVEVVFGNSPSPHFATLWRQARALDFKPKLVWPARASLFYTDVASWGGDLPLGIFCESWWDPTYLDSPGIGDTTPQSLFERWQEKSGQPLNPNIGWGYASVQIIIDAIERAGTLDGAEVIKALKETDFETVVHRVKFGEAQFSAQALSFFQWYKTDEAWGWESKIIISQLDFIPVTAEPIWPVPYD